MIKKDKAAKTSANQTGRENMATANDYPEVFRDVNGFYWISLDNQKTFTELSHSEQPATLQAVEMADYMKLSWLHDLPNDLKDIAEMYAYEQVWPPHFGPRSRRQNQ